MLFFVFFKRNTVEADHFENVACVNSQVKAGTNQLRFSLNGRACWYLVADTCAVLTDGRCANRLADGVFKWLVRLATTRYVDS